MNKNTPSRHPYNFESLFLKLPTNSFPGFYSRPWICTCKNQVICILWFLVVWSDSLLRRKRTTKIVNVSSPTSKCGRRLRGVARRILLKTKQKVRMKICLNFKLLSKWRSGVEIILNYGWKRFEVVLIKQWHTDIFVRKPKFAQKILFIGFESRTASVYRTREDGNSSLGGKFKQS